MGLREKIRQQLYDETLSPNQTIFRDFVFGLMIMFIIIEVGAWIKTMIFGG